MVILHMSKLSSTSDARELMPLTRSMMDVIVVSLPDVVNLSSTGVEKGYSQWVLKSKTLQTLGQI
jgi:hypothetical protein